jgi:hypothetical protein
MTPPSSPPNTRKVRIRPEAPPAIHLDQWIWIELAKAEAGTNPNWLEAHKAVRAVHAKGKAMFPLSMSRIIETCRRKETVSRGRVVEYMAKTWGLNAVRPWHDMAPYEARNAVLQSLGLPILDLRPHLYGKGMWYAFGGEFSLSWKEGASAEARAREGAIKSMLNGNDAFLLMKNDEVAAGLAALGVADVQTAKGLQEARDRDYGHPDKTMRAKIAEARFMAYTMGDYLVTALTEMVPDPKAWMNANIGYPGQPLPDPGKIRRVREAIPSMHTFWVLSDHRNRTRAVEPNDIGDMDLCLAIPYSAVVATERQWCQAARQAGLDKLYGSQLVHQPEELVAALQPFI